MNDFYRIESTHREPNSISCKVSFNPEHNIFKGHFPGQPVVPGVCMMEMVRELLEQFTDTKLWLKAAGQVKFLQFLTPDTTPEVNVSWQLANSVYNVNASFKGDNGDMFKLNGSFEHK